MFYCKSDMHVRPMRFDILCTPTDSSEKTQLMCSTVLLCLFVSKYDINGSRLNYSTMSSNKFRYINRQIVCKDKAKRDQCCSQNTSTNKFRNLYLQNVTSASTRWLHWFHTELSPHILQQNCAHDDKCCFCRQSFNKKLNSRLLGVRTMLQWMELSSSCCHSNEDVCEEFDVIGSRAASVIFDLQRRKN